VARDLDEISIPSGTAFGIEGVDDEDIFGIQRPLQSVGGLSIYVRKIAIEAEYTVRSGPGETQGVRDLWNAFG